MEAILAILIQALLPVLGSLLSYGVFAGTRYIQSKTRSEQGWDALSKIGEIADTVVDELNQTMADGLRQATADGKLSADDAARLKMTAVSKVQSQIPDALAKAAGLAVNSLDQWIASRIERSVAEGKPRRIQGLPIAVSGE